LWFTPLRPFDTVQFYATALLFVIALPVIFDKTKDSKPLNFLGDITYPLYLIQGIVIGCIFGARMTPFVAKWFGAAKLLPPLPQSLVVMLPILFVIILAAVITHYAVERPLETAFRRLISRVAKIGWPWSRTASSPDLAEHRQAVLASASRDDARRLSLTSTERDG
jgi:peptidoglycan/LPS O-acetylase OafA/YrhL